MPGSRSLKKGWFVCQSLIKRAAQVASSGKKNQAIKTWSRASTVVPDFVGLTIAVHNGKSFMPIFITEDMVGHKLGEFSPTRTFKSHGGKKAKDK